MKPSWNNSTVHDSACKVTSWCDTILNDFIPNVSKLTLVADPDNLLTEERLALELHGRGFELIAFNDPIEFRYAYESKYRSMWDRGEQTDLVVILRLEDTELEALPYDLLQAGRRLSFNLGALFPNLSYPVIEKLDRGLLDKLYDAQCKFPPDRMGDNATMDFMLRHVFRISVELISNDVDLLRMLLRLHYGKIKMPEILLHRLVQILNDTAGIKGWPLEQIVFDDKAFFGFLQERWPAFLERKGEGEWEQTQEHSPTVRHKYPGPTSLPFGHQDIRVYIDNLFVEGKLTPVQVSGVTVPAESWIRSGIATVDTDDDVLRISRLFDLVEKELPTDESRFSDWTSFALKWAELSSLVHCGNNTQDQVRLKHVGDAMNTTFAGWLRDHYASLINLPPNNPAMLHHVPRRLVRDMDDTGNYRMVLIVVDGLALDQWVTVRQLLQKQDSSLVMRESATFAWIPTLTSVSRQAIFSGKIPQFFPSSIQSTHGEEKLWKQFWEGHGLSRLDVAYQRGLGDGDALSVLDNVIHPSTKAVGLVVDKIDKIMHGMQLGAAGMHNQIEQWCQGGFLGKLIGHLLDQRYDVWLTADHGNIECEGKGRPSEGAIAETRGERVRVYPTAELRATVAKAFPSAAEWQPIGLPPDYYPLVAGGRDAFVSVGSSIVGHGGLSIEEVIVPLVKIERKAT